MLVTSQGTPIAPPSVIKALQAIEPRFSLRYMPASELQPVPYWAVMLKWVPNDPRHKLIQDGQMAKGTDYDLFTCLPEDCSVEQAAGYVRQSCIRWGRTKCETSKHLDKVNNWNLQQMDNVKNEQMDYAEELVKTNAKTIFRDQGKTIPKIFMTER